MASRHYIPIQGGDPMYEIAIELILVAMIAPWLIANSAEPVRIVSNPRAYLSRKQRRDR